MADRHTYSKKELEVYFDRICLPDSERIYDVTGISNDDKIDFLHLLQKHQLVKVPWENLVQHYSWHKVVNVKPKHLFKKIVRSHGRGGYCMEANFFFHTVLLSLGFDVYMCGSRIYKSTKGGFGGWTHVVNLVTIAGTKWLCDGGYGGNGPSRPVPLLHGEIQTQIEPAQYRLLYEPIRQNLNRAQKVWIYQHRFDEYSDWVTDYCFPDLEFIPEDIESMNFEPWLDRQTFFTHKVVAMRFTTTNEKNSTRGPGSPLEANMTGEIDGAITLNHDVLKWRRNGKKVVEFPLKSETDRLEALCMYFGITFSDEDIEAIKGTAAMIGSTAMENP
ncbi:Arylamine N-acetyltransferase 2 [Pseudocercospora fuligena]|uniref:Arylamine N-acetyltransferase 2 n=1 Tax=Pseudocercospora fuligena TaxID=685502 RepID=A0A8H6REY8_9PEZI|nr:Arylamine N-acetyltransferase 2 [Pseudocercospora fuligena]